MSASVAGKGTLQRAQPTAQFISHTHTSADIEQTLDAARAAMSAAARSVGRI